MKFDLQYRGFFDGGKFLPIVAQDNDTDFSKGLNKGTINGIEFLTKLVHENLSINLVCMPDSVGVGDFMELNIFIIYKEAYYSIAFGNYNAGILLLGQLLEVTLKEIILINTGKKLNEATLGQAIQHAENKKILNKDHIRILKEFNTEIRNSYTHYKLQEILPLDIRVPTWMVKNRKGSFKPEEFLIGLAKLQKLIKEGKAKPVFVDPLKMPGIAAILKEDIDRKKSIKWLWSINLLLDQIFSIYLTKKKYEDYFAKYGRPFENLPSFSMDDLLSQ